MEAVNLKGPRSYLFCGLGRWTWSVCLLLALILKLQFGHNTDRIVAGLSKVIYVKLFELFKV